VTGYPTAKRRVVMLRRMKKLVKDKDVCVLATVMDNVPHCSLMSYAADRDCREIYMMTQKGTKKYRNLAANKSVSLLIDTREEDCGADREKLKALTVSGIFTPIRAAAKRKLVRRKLLKKHPQLRAFAEDPDAEVFAVKVKSFQLLDGVKDAYFEKVR
jgi:nitroimidazol reductase NimA-like FMN-containing flavoprotein (pyridoxamine 5'-phosphate oxidase superfamily)